MMLQLSLINGLVFGIEHMSEEDDEDVSYIVVLHFFIFRFVFMKMKP
jgi:hypothetical protein